MPVPVYSVGQVVGAADVNLWFLPLAAYKTSATTRANNTTRSADPDLQLAIPASSAYEVHAYISYSTASVSGIGCNFALSSWSGISGHWSAVYRVTGDTVTTSGAGPGSAIDFSWGDYAGAGGTWASAATPGDGKFHTILIEATVIVAGTAGTLSFNWAQDTTNATALSINTGSRLTARRIG